METHTDWGSVCAARIVEKREIKNGNENGVEFSLPFLLFCKNIADSDGIWPDMRAYDRCDAGN